MTRTFASESIAILLALCSCVDEAGSEPVRTEQFAAGGVRSEYAMIDLGLGTARALNDRGQVVVGRSDRDTGAVRSYVWTEKEGIVEIEMQGRSCQAVAINNAGLVVGTAYGPQHAFAWTRQRGAIDLGTLGGLWSSAAAVNNRGEVVGSSETAAGETHAFIWTEQDGMMDLGTLGTIASNAMAINESGRVIGIVAPGAFTWTRQAGMTSLGTLPNLGPAYVAIAVNDSGAVVGEAESSPGERAFLWTKADGMVDLGTLGGDTAIPVDINNRGEVVGRSSTAPLGPDLQVHAFIWTRQEGMTDLGTLGGTRSHALAINDAGDVVGYSLTADSINHAFLWTRQRGMIDLGHDTQGSIAYWINQRGQIAGDTFDYFDPTLPGRAVLWE